MKYTYYLIAILLTMTSCSDTELPNSISENDKTPTGNMERSVVFYNVENLFDTEDNPLKNDNDFTPNGRQHWTEERYETKLDRITEALKLINVSPALIGLVEIENKRVLEDLIDEDFFHGINMGIAHFESPDTRGIDCALLYDKDLFEVQNEEKLKVELVENRDYKTRDILYVSGLLNGIQTHVFVNHWSSRREGKLQTEHKRLQAAFVLREKVDEILDDEPNANIIILGDFNDHPDDKSLEFILKAKESGYAEGRELINLLYDENENGEGTIVHEGDWMVFDQVIISQAIYDRSNGLGVKENDAFILDDKKLIFTANNGYQKPNATYGGPKYYGGYSDHLPVYIILK